MKLKAQLQPTHSIPLVLLIISGALLYLAKLPVEPTTWAGWATAVMGALGFAIQRSIVNVTSDPSNLSSSTGPKGPAGSEQTLPSAAPAAGASGPTGPAAA